MAYQSEIRQHRWLMLTQPDLNESAKLDRTPTDFGEESKLTALLERHERWRLDEVLVKEGFEVLRVAADVGQDERRLGRLDKELDLLIVHQCRVLEDDAPRLDNKW